jgi:hypothetical protein
MLKKIKVGWPQVAIIAIVAAVFLGSYFLPDGSREELRSDLAWIWGALATFAGPLLRKKLAHELDEESAGGPS